MSVPTFVSIGTLNSGTSTSAAPALPASRVNGNVLIAFVTMNAAKVFSLSGSPGGWTLLSPQASNSGTTTAVAWRIVDGSEAACPFVWTGSHGFQARCLQYTGNDTGSPIGSMDVNTGGSGNTQGTIGISATRANSGVVAMMNWQSVGTTSTPSGWVSRDNDTLTVAGTIASKTLTAGLVNIGDNTNPTFGNPGVGWSIVLLEILSPSLGASAAIDQTLPKLTQSITVAEVMPSTITQTLLGLTQDFEAISAFNATIAQVLPGFTQEIDGTVANTASHISQTLKGFTQTFNGLMEPSGTIDQTLHGITQAWIGGIPPVADIDQTFESITQSWIGKEVFTSTINTALSGFSQDFEAADVLGSTINMVLCARNANASAVGVIEQSHIGAPIGQPTVTVQCNNAGSLVVAVLQSVATSSSGHTVTSLTNVPGQPAWQKRSSKQGTQSGSAVGLEVWWFISTAPISPTVCHVGWNGNLSAWENACIEYTNVDVDRPWDLDSSLPATSSNGSLTSTSTPNITGLSTASDHALLVGFWGANTPAVPNAAAGYTRDVSEQTSTGTHTSGNIIEVSKTVNLPQSNIAIGMGSGGTAWNFIADAIRPQQLTTAMTQDFEAVVSPAGQVEIVFTLQTIMQSMDVTVDPAAIIDQTFTGFLQEEIDVTSTACTIDQTLPGFTQEIDNHVTLVGNEVAGQTDQTFEGFTQQIDVVSYAGVIDQTLAGFSQEMDIDEEIPSDIVEQILFGIQMDMEVVEIIPTAIDQTLLGFSQEIDVESFAATIDMVLGGILQEIDVVEEMASIIDQTLPGFTQDFEGNVDDGDVVALSIDQTLSGFSQEIDVSALRIDIDQVFEGFTQKIVVHAPSKDDRRPNHAAIMPSKEMPIHPGELEFFRRKVYGRAVDAMVPPPVTARYNLTTRQYPTSRISVDRTPLGKKPS